MRPPTFVRADVPQLETLLVVDDEIWMRQITVRALRLCGYVVLEACDGQTALTVAESFPDPIHLVLSDVIMPGMAGAELVDQLHRHRPGLKAIFMSGYRGDELASRGVDASRVVFVQKPFSAAELQRCVREALDEAAAPARQPADLPDGEGSHDRGRDDPARLKVLRATELLDSERDERFDRLTRLVARFLHAPVVALTLLDAHRDFYKSLVGAGEPLESARELRGRTLCQHILRSRSPLAIADAHDDARHATLSDVVAFGVRAFLGIPLVVDGQTIGALAAADSEPRTWSPEDVRTLADLAALVLGEIELRAATRRSADARAALGRANLQLYLAKNTAETANRAKSEFLAHMSHELRTPLNSIIGFANILRRNAGNTFSERDLNYAERIGANGGHLLQLVDRILDLSKVEQDELQLRCTWVQVEEVVRRVCGDFADRAADAGVALLMEIDGQSDEQGGEPVRRARAPIHTDEGKLRQVLVNLVGNALKFTSVGGHVRVTLTHDEESGEPRRLDIADTGIGIAPEAQARVFEAFEQAEEDTSARFGGTGLGLRISRALCESLGFGLTLESVVGAGSTLSITFPPSAGRRAS
jgi:signal transduction histidine kinase/CheY-like chemotaxis protein